MIVVAVILTARHLFCITLCIVLLLQCPLPQWLMPSQGDAVVLASQFETDVTVITGSLELLK